MAATGTPGRDITVFEPEFLAAPFQTIAPCLYIRLPAELRKT